jgi:hypothetical protein
MASAVCPVEPFPLVAFPDVELGIMTGYQQRVADRNDTVRATNPSIFKHCAPRLAD